MNENTTKGEKMDRERIAELRRQYNGIWSEHRHHHPFGSLAHSTLDIRECLDALEAALARVEGAEAEVEKSAALASRLAGVISHMEIGVLPSSAERCAARWATSSATDRASYERGWEAREAEGLHAAPESKEAALVEVEAVRVVPELTGMPSPTEWMAMLKARGIDSDSRIADAHESGVIDGVRWIGSRLSALPVSRVLRNGEVAVAQAYLDAIENAANQFCGSCRDKGSCLLGMMAIGKGCGAWRLDAARINALRTQATEGAAIYPNGYRRCTTCEHLNDCPERLGQPVGDPCRSWKYCAHRDWRTQPAEGGA